MDSDPKQSLSAGDPTGSWGAHPEFKAASTVTTFAETSPAPVVHPVVAATARKKAQPAKGRIIAVGSGKGGVGKSLVTSSLGISMARHGKKVVVIDADLGGANLHTCLGLPTPSLTLSDFISRRVESIDDVILETGVKNLGLISGAHDHLAASNLKYAQKIRLLSRIATVDADFILLDIGAGISFNIVDFFLIAEQGLLVVIPEPSSIENAYRFLKMSFYRHMWRALKSGPSRKVVEQAMDQKNRDGIRTPIDLLDAVARRDSATGRYLKEHALSFRPRLLINQVRYPEDERLGASMASVCRRHLGIDIDAIGTVRFDESVWKANRKRRPFMLDSPESAAGSSLERVAQALMFGSPTVARLETKLMLRRLSEQDHYQVLEVSYDANSDEIQSAFETARDIYSHEALVSNSILSERERRRTFHRISGGLSDAHCRR